jgi:hypothetical protein
MLHKTCKVTAGGSARLAAASEASALARCGSGVGDSLTRSDNRNFMAAADQPQAVAAGDADEDAELAAIWDGNALQRLAKTPCSHGEAPRPARLANTSARAPARGT